MPLVEEKRTEAHEESVSVCKIWCPSPRTRDNQKLLREEEIFGNDSLDAAGAKEIGNSG